MAVVRVAVELLHRTGIYAALHQVRREGVADRVARHALGDGRVL